MRNIYCNMESLMDLEPLRFVDKWFIDLMTSVGNVSHVRASSLWAGSFDGDGESFWRKPTVGPQIRKKSADVQLTLAEFAA